MSSLHASLRFFFRPLATSLDDKITLQDCLEVGRTAKVGELSLMYQMKTDDNLHSSVVVAETT